MGGLAKGLLAAPDGPPIVTRTARLFAELGIECVLVGEHRAYRELGIETVADDAVAKGPLAGLIALLRRAGGKSVVAIACDMPLVERELLRRLIASPSAPVVAPRRCVDGRAFWEPLFARYDASTLGAMEAFAAEGGSKLQRLLDRLGATILEITSAESVALTDWDTLPDVAGHGR